MSETRTETDCLGFAEVAADRATFQSGVPVLGRGLLRRPPLLFYTAITYGVFRGKVRMTTGHY